MILLSTIHGTEDVLHQYLGDEHCVIYEKLDNKLGYWLVEVFDMECCARRTEEEQDRYNINKNKPLCLCGYCDRFTDPNCYFPTAIAHIPEMIMLHLIEDGFMTMSMSDKEWNVQIALGTAPVYRPYMITGEAA